jgi:hypothetical protein
MSARQMGQVERIRMLGSRIVTFLHRRDHAGDVGV